MDQHVFRIHGPPVDMVSDRGPQFSSQFWKAFCTLIGSSASLSSGFHLQSNGQSERAKQDLETTLRCLVSSSRRKRSAHLLPRCLSAAVAVPGGEPGRPSSRPPPGIDDKRVTIGPRLHGIVLGRRYGYTPRICRSGWNPTNSPASLSAHSQSPRL